ncbi:uncharacterized protein LOC106876292 isoform X2 [Octopus bimaculoides]|uniref:uncharacterized protein LOC106876292 isoform X2 n=1 Tax=Octopus bimaculoides TaxID=37653 RepID=UPI00071D8CD1|nr:uncharacterized protein LOC106876292 isoform X2 [Octopus bimaculoides]|eukprot:XP_014780274.1 PREDICTED: uncharacterized protein LOC106876292 isoform X2 [Octopus bimaculoides]
MFAFPVIDYINLKLTLVFFVYAEFFSIHVRLNTCERNFIVENNQEGHFNITLYSISAMFFDVRHVEASRYHSKFCLYQDKKRGFFSISLGCFEKWWPQQTKFLVKEDVKR